MIFNPDNLKHQTLDRGLNLQHFFLSDDDECVNENICMENAACVNIPGSYNCACLEGFVFNEENNACEGEPLIVVHRFPACIRPHAFSNF